MGGVFSGGKMEDCMRAIGRRTTATGLGHTDGKMEEYSKVNSVKTGSLPKWRGLLTD